jgi:hypothetical protein
MEIADLLLEFFGRIPPLAEGAVEGLDADGLAARPAPGANSIGWLIWHLARVQDHHVAELIGTTQLWETGEFAGRVGVPADSSNTGYGHGPEEVARIRPDGPDALLDYLSAVDQRTRDMLSGLSAADLDRIVDRRWDPPVTLGVRLVSVADDCLQHAGQAAYVRGLLDA